MPLDTITIGLIIVGIVMGGVIGYFFSRAKILTMEDYNRKALNKLEKTELEAANIKEEALSRVERIKQQITDDELRISEQFKRMENLVVSKKEQIKKKEIKLEAIKMIISDENKAIEEAEAKIANGKTEFKQSLAKKVGTTLARAKEDIIAEINRDLHMMKDERIHKMEQTLEEEKIKIGKNMVVGAIQRYSSPTSVEKKNLAVIVQRDDMKGKIIGHNASNLVLLEELTECDIIFNDAPNTIIISCFDLVKKHIARETIEKLLKERAVGADIIRKKIEEVKAEMESQLIKIGKETIKKLELKDREFPPDFYRIVGRLQFRTSYGQNIIKHSLEVGHFATMLGAELGVNVETCKIGGFLHDLGKAIDQEVGDPHDLLTKQLMEKYGFSYEEVHAAWTHHDAIPIETAEAMLVKAGDAISAGRPGARQETLEKYLERIRAIEAIADSYEGVKKTYAISAGREVRVMVEPQTLEDESLYELASSIANEIQENVAYPGKIKVNVIRRTQSTNYAKNK